jgi:hypothetical protein
MEWERVSNDDLEVGIGHFFGLVSAGLGKACLWLREVDRRQMFLADGAPDLVQWCSARFGLAHSTARRLVDTAKRLADLPVLSLRLEAGDLSFDQVEAISKVARAETEEALIDDALGLTVSGLERMARRANPPSNQEAVDQSANQYLYIQRTLDGVAGTLRAGLLSSDLDVVESAVRKRAERMPVNPDTGVFDPWPQRMADGLVEVCATTGDETGAKAQVTIHADLSYLVEGGSETSGSGFAESELGSLLANETARRLACDSIVECVVYHKNNPLGVGRRTRTVPRWLRRLLQHRDGGCRFPGCGRSIFVHAHHIIHWVDEGPTDLDNLILLCGFHHRFLHEYGWSVVKTEYGFDFRRPDGESYPPVRDELHPRLRTLVEQRT